MDICMLVDYLGNTQSHDCLEWQWDKEINIWTDWELLSKQQDCARQFSINKYFSDEDKITSNWLKEFIYASSTYYLCSAVNKKYNKRASIQRGGVLYHLVLCEIFPLSHEVGEIMLTFLDLFKCKGVAM